MNKKNVSRYANNEARQLRKLAIFARIADDKIFRDVLERIALQFALVSNEFPKALCALAARLRSERTRTEVISNLWDEQGQGEPANGHRAQMQKFLDGFVPQGTRMNFDASWQTRLFLNSTIGLYQSGTVSEAMGALLFIEMITPWEFSQISSWMKRNTRLSVDDLRFWDDHVLHDGMHMVSLLEACSDDSELNEREFLSGISQARAIEEFFWQQFL
jgi:pyrroloquinoline quinone (PQQ) biosynthesis protein C